MKRKIFYVIITSLFIYSFCISAVLAGGDSYKCDTRYPVVMAHGMFATDDIFGFINYWWGIEKALEDEGATVFVTKVNCMDGTRDKAMEFRKQFLYYLASSGEKKANVIGHSHGTIYTRYAMTNLDIGHRVRSHTSICGPHRGSSIADVMLGTLPDTGAKMLASISDVVYTFLLGDSDPDSYQNAVETTQDFMRNKFNPNTPNLDGVYYQSYAGKIKYLTSDLVLMPTWMVIKHYEGANDGLVSVTSAKWGNFRGVESGAWWCGGVSHINAVNHFFGITPGFDAKGWYVDMVQDLKDRGY